jgi:hypothetical protein
MTRLIALALALAAATASAQTPTLTCEARGTFAIAGMSAATR